MTLHRDARGAQLVEYLLIVGLVAIVALGGFGAFGSSTSAKAEAQAHCISSLDCAAGSGGETGPDDSAAVPTRAEIVDAAATPQAPTQGGGGGVWGAIETARSRGWSFTKGFAWDGFAKGLVWGTLQFAGNQARLVATDPYEAYVGQWGALATGLASAAVHYHETWDALSNDLSGEWHKDKARLLGRGVFEVASLIAPWTKIGKAKALTEVAGLTKTVSATDKIVEGERVIDAQIGADGIFDATHRTLADASGGWCFVAGTPVATESGLRPIESIAVGDLVVARDERTGETGLRRVAHTVVNRQRPVLSLQLTAADGTAETIGVTPQHPFFVPSRGWVDAGELGLGAEVQALDGRTLQVAAMTSLADVATVYNFEVDEAHTYFVGATGAWVHNDCAQSVRGAAAAAKTSAAARALLEAAAGETVTVPLSMIRPTQLTYGAAEVQIRTQKLRKALGITKEMDAEAIREALQSKAVRRQIEEILEEKGPQVVVGSGGRPYLVDGHHTLRMFSDMGLTEAPVVVRRNAAQLSLSDFWDEMSRMREVYTVDGTGRMRPVDSLPASLAGLVDDPYRSLAWLARRGGAYERTGEPFQEFAWANFFRTRVQIASRDADGFHKAARDAVELATSPEAASLPGYLGQLKRKKAMKSIDHLLKRLKPGGPKGRRWALGDGVSRRRVHAMRQNSAPTPSW